MRAYKNMILDFAENARLTGKSIAYKRGNVDLDI